MIRAIVAIARYTIVEQIRNRLYLIILFFGAMILASSVLVGALAPESSGRVIFDLGLLAIEIFGVATAVFGAVSLVLQEIESKTIYLILTRPVGRFAYIFGRFKGLQAAVTVTMMAMAALHLGALLLNSREFESFTWGWSFWPVYALTFLLILCKMAVITAVAVFFSLFATSQVSALVFTGFFWVAGHFATELEFLIERSVSGPLFWLIGKPVSWLLPNFSLLNARDLFEVTGFATGERLLWGVLYAAGYSGFYLALSGLLFRRKEF